MIYISSKNFHNCLCCNVPITKQMKSTYYESLSYICWNCNSCIYYSYFNKNKILIDSFTINLKLYNMEFNVLYVSIFDDILISYKNNIIYECKIRTLKFNIKKIIKLCLRKKRLHLIQ